MPGKVYERILTERLMEVAAGKVSKEQEGFRKGRGCVDQIFAMKMLVEYSYAFFYVRVTLQDPSRISENSRMRAVPPKIYIFKKKNFKEYVRVNPWVFGSLHILVLFISTPKNNKLSFPHLERRWPGGEGGELGVRLMSEHGFEPHQCHLESFCLLLSCVKSSTCHPDTQTVVAQQQR